MRASVLIPVVLLLVPARASAQEHDHTKPSDVGSVAFPVSCNAEAQMRMNRGVAMLHSFWFTEAAKTFEGVLQADPGCGIAYWGIALAQFGNPMGGGTGPALQTAGWAAAQKGLQTGARSARDSAYLNAAVALFKDADKVDNRTRMRAYEAAMADAVQKFPTDTEAQIFHGIIMVANAPPTDLTFAQQKKAAQILTALYLKQPDHPGLAHYIIHAFDSPPLAQNALAAARKYASLAPAAPHALHMPSHIFTRLGYWDESIRTNRKSMNLEPTPGTKSHAADYMVYAYLQKGQDDSAAAVINEIGDGRGGYPAGTQLSYNLFAMPARYALERNDWKAAAALPVLTAPPASEAVTHFARALGAARSGDATTAKAEIEVLKDLSEKLKAQKDPYWPVVIDAQMVAASAWAAHASGQHAEALQYAAQAADLEESVEKHPVTPGPLIPARELLGDILMVHGKPAEALAAYEKTLQREPNRERTILGAARAAKAAGKSELAKKYYELLTQVLAANSARPEREEAVAFVK